MNKLSQLSRSIEGKVVLITGAASGMGRATAFLFAEQGARVAATDLDLDGVAETVSCIEEAGGEAGYWKLDVTDSTAITASVADIVGHFGALDILINNAGVSLPVGIENADYEDKWLRSVDVLLTAHTRLIRAALPTLRKSLTPRIINIASTEGLGATPGNSPYTASKHGVIGLTRSLAVELGKEGITVNAICPGPILTAMTDHIDEQDRATYARRRTALRRYGDPEEVAHASLSLALPAAAFITGVALPVDGGLTLRRG